MPSLQTDAHAVADDESVSTAVVEAVSEVSGRDLLDLPPLYEVVDGDALDGVFASTTGPSTFQFEYAGYDVTVSNDGECAVAVDGGVHTADRSSAVDGMAD